MPLRTPKKVCLVAISLARGGAERSTALLSQLLEQRGFDVHLVVLNDKVDYEFSGKLFNLGKLKIQKDKLPHRFLRFQKLRQYFLREKFDWIIDNRTRPVAMKEWYYLNYIYRRFRVVYVVRSGNLAEYLPKHSRVSKQIIKRAERIVGVSKHIASEINTTYNTDKAVTIYNPVESLPTLEKTAKTEPYILFVGRLVEAVKNFSLLFEAYQKSELPHKNIRLKVVGSGPDLEQLRAKVLDLGLSEKVAFIPFTSQIYPFYQQALFTVLSSRYEGFPRVLIESLSVGTPVVSVDCISGPGEIIKNEQNGLLVPNYDANALATAMNRLVEDKKLYEICKSNSQSSVAHLSVTAIADQWEKLLAS